VNALFPTPDAARTRAEAASRQRLLNAYLRETGRGLVMTGDGLARIPLPDSTCVIAVELRHRSVHGQHAYGEQVWQERAGLPRRTLCHDELVQLLLDELEAVAAHVLGDSGHRARRKSELAGQIASSVEATARYLRYDPPPPPTEPRSLTRHAEQSLVYGHPFHPIPKSSRGFGADLARYAPELGAAFPLHWFAVHPSLLVERRVAPGTWIPAAVDKLARTLLRHDRHDYPLLPAHPWQAGYLARQPHVATLLSEGRLVALGPLGGPVYPTSSVRTVCDPAFPTAWKLPLHVQITNFVRTNPLPHLIRAADASALVAELASGWHHEGFGVLIECGYRTIDPDVIGADLAADFAVLFRENPFTDGRAAPRVVASLLEERSGTVPDLIHEVRRAGRSTSAGHVAEWLRRYLRISLVPLLEVFDEDGVSFEGHVQNSLLHTEHGWPARFWVRDMEGTSVSRKRLRRNGLEDSPLLYDDEEAWLRLRYHAVTNHVGHLVHVLGRHGQVNESLLWRTVRETLARTQCRSAQELLTAPTLPAKANLLSRFTGRAEDPLYVEIRNPLYE
jgi:L-2,3-diaminopropanoate---citrate ligase